jgi:hypothetical protein
VCLQSTSTHIVRSNLFVDYNLLQQAKFAKSPAASSSAACQAAAKKIACTQCDPFAAHLYEKVSLLNLLIIALLCASALDIIRIAIEC